MKPCQFQDAAECAWLELFVQGHNTTDVTGGCGFLENDVATTLSDLPESEMFKGSDCFLARNAPQLRH